MAKYRKKPVVIDAIQFTGERGNIKQVMAFLSECKTPVGYNHNGTIQICTLEGTMDVVLGDWVIKGVKGEFYPCKPDIFEATYEAVA